MNQERILFSGRALIRAQPYQFGGLYNKEQGRYFEEVQKGVYQELGDYSGKLWIDTKEIATEGNK